MPCSIFSTFHTSYNIPVLTTEYFKPDDPIKEKREFEAGTEPPFAGPRSVPACACQKPPLHSDRDLP